MSHQFHYLTTSLQKHHIDPKPTQFNLVAPYLNIFSIFMGNFSLNLTYGISSVSMLYSYPIIFPTIKVKQFFEEPKNKSSILWTALAWCAPSSWWKKKFHMELNRFNIQKLEEDQVKDLVSVYVIHLPYFLNPQTKMLWTQSQAMQYGTYPSIKIFAQNSNSPLFTRKN